jgi:hypothetical protein
LFNFFLFFTIATSLACHWVKVKSLSLRQSRGRFAGWPTRLTPQRVVSLCTPCTVWGKSLRRAFWICLDKCS